MVSAIRRLRIKFLIAQVGASRDHCATLANKFESALNNTEKSNIARQYDLALTRTHTRQLLLELLERKERESANDRSAAI
jgi:hypothetical protein